MSNTFSFDSDTLLDEGYWEANMHQFINAGTGRFVAELGPYVFDSVNGGLDQVHDGDYNNSRGPQPRREYFSYGEAPLILVPKKARINPGRREFYIWIEIEMNKNFYSSARGILDNRYLNIVNSLIVRNKRGAEFQRSTRVSERGRAAYILTYSI